MNLRKVALWSGGVVVLLGAAAAIALHVLVDPERLRKAARDRAHTAWGRELLLGEVRFHLFPLPSMRAARISLANPSWAREPLLLQAESVRADLEILPLLTGKVRIKSLALDGVKAALEVAEDGTASWDLEEGRPPAPASGPADEADPLTITAFHVRNARILHRKHREESAPWLIEEAWVESEPGRKDVSLKARLTRFDRPLQVKAQFADLSGLGRKGAVSEGKVDFDWGHARLSASGRFPLEKHLVGQDLTAAIEAGSMDEVFEFFGVKRGKTAPLKMSLKAREAGGRVEVSDIIATLGALTIKGDAKVSVASRHTIHARLETDRLDWLKTLQDAGGQIKPPRRDTEVFHADPIAWRAVSSIGALHGTADLKIKSLKMGNGLELANVRTRVAFGDGRMEFNPFATELLGGSATGVMAFDSRRKTVRFELDGDNLLLERWFHERGNKLPFKGGPMKVKAKLTLAGSTYRDLAASVSGPFALRMGKGVWDSKRASEAEQLMVSALQPKNGDAIRFECAAADLEFKSGLASGKHLLGARSDVTQLLTSGAIDFNQETIDLRGKVFARSGLGIGLATFASDVHIGGKLAKPTMQLDRSATPLVLARVGAAIASAGATLLGSALVDVVEAKNNPCEAVFR